MLAGVYLVIAIMISSLPVIADEKSQQLDLSHEPIQPLTMPLGLDKQKIALGELLFHEPRLSQDNRMSCSTCHILDDNGATRRAHDLDRNGNELNINTLTVFNSGYNHHLFWDGRAQSLEKQINFVVLGSQEFATSWSRIIDKLSQDPNYQHKFNSLYTDGITAANIRNAIATFERSLVTINSRFDRFLQGDTNAITIEEKEGYKLFKSYGCTACHQGRNVGGNLFVKFGIFSDHFAGRNNLSSADFGRFNVTGKADDRHVFRVPSLRLAALTPPYFHDGSVSTLEDAVAIMAKYQLGRVIPAQDIDLIVKFLKSLPGEYKGRPLSTPQREDDVTRLTP